jgi:ubiquinone/menaquinone biosynthesis C-methylase UbiE
MKSHKTEWDVYYKLMLANSASSLYKTAKTLGLLDIKKAFAVKDLAREKNLQELPLSFFLQALCDLGVLKQEGELYSLSSDVEKLQGPYGNLGQEYWDYLTQFLSTGIPFKKSENPVSDFQEQMKSLSWMMQSSAVEMCSVLKRDDVTTILDVGAASGVWSFQLLKKFPNAKSDLFDFPFLLEIARARNSFGDRVQFHEGNVFESEFGEKKYDLAVMGNISHFHSLDLNLFLFKKIFSALKDNGSFILLDAFSTDERGTFARASYQMGLTMKTLHARVYSHEELSDRLKAAGFLAIEFISLDVAPYTMGMIHARK